MRIVRVPDDAAGGEVIRWALAKDRCLGLIGAGEDTCSTLDLETCKPIIITVSSDATGVQSGASGVRCLESATPESSVFDRLGR